MPHPLGEAKILSKKKVWCFFFVKKWDKGVWVIVLTNKGRNC